MTSEDPEEPSWIRPPVESEGIDQYLRILRERAWVVTLAVVVTTGMAIAYVVTTDKVYEAEADVLISPVGEENPIDVNLGLLQSSNDPLRVVETAARLITTPESAEAAAELTGLSLDDPEDLLDDVKAEPVADSDLVGVTASASTPRRAADLANAFAEATIASRTEEMVTRGREAIQRLRSGPSDENTRARVMRLRQLISGPVPDMTLETRATPPTSPVAPRPLISLIAGIVGGLALGTGAAFLLHGIDPRFRRESQLRSQFDLPVLARIPHQEGGDDGPLTIDKLDGEAIESLRRLRAGLTRARQSDLGSAVLITSSSPSDGKTTTAFNLAAVLALSGTEVILIEADLRIPSVARMVGAEPKGGVVSTLIEETTLDEGLTTVPSYGSNLKMLLAESSGPWLPELFTLDRARDVIDEARRKVDFVIIDSPPLTEVADILPLAQAVPDTVLVMRLGSSRMDRIADLAELLVENAVTPSGFVVIGAPSHRSTYYHDYAAQTKVADQSSTLDGSANSSVGGESDLADVGANSDSTT